MDTCISNDKILITVMFWIGIYSMYIYPAYKTTNYDLLITSSSILHSLILEVVVKILRFGQSVEGPMLVKAGRLT